MPYLDTLLSQHILHYFLPPSRDSTSILLNSTKGFMMAVISASIDAFIFTSLAISGSLILFLHKQNSANHTPLRQPLNILVVLHTLYIIYIITVLWPPNLFGRLKVPLTMPSDSIRRLLLRHAGLESDASLPKALEALLTRLSSFEMRTLYVRSCRTLFLSCNKL